MLFVPFEMSIDSLQNEWNSMATVQRLRCSAISAESHPMTPSSRIHEFERQDRHCVAPKLCLLSEETMDDPHRNLARKTAQNEMKIRPRIFTVPTKTYIQGEFSISSSNQLTIMFGTAVYC